MPQKRNPISSELMLAAAKGVRQHAGLMLDAMVQDFERATGPGMPNGWRSRKVSC
jgi:Adenylosuccinate lyase